MTGCQSILTPLTLTPDISPSDARAKFIAQVHDMMRFVQAEPFIEALELQKESLKVFYRVFFGYLKDWSEREKQKHTNIPNDPNVERLRDTAIRVQKDLENNIIESACCYLSLAHSKGIVAMSSKAYHAPSLSGVKEIEWSKATTHILCQNIIKRQELLDSTKTLALGLHFLEQFKATHGSLQELTEAVYGVKAGEKTLKSLRSALRNGGFDTARKIIAGLPKPKGLFSSHKKDEAFDALISTLNAYVNLLEKYSPHLHVDASSKKLFLTEGELKVVLITQMKELEKKERFLNKYFMPYIEHTMKEFAHLQDKLTVVGSLEALMTLYIQMINGIAQPLKETKDVRDYEANVVAKVQYLLSSQFKEIENLQHFNDEDLCVFNENMKIFQDILEKVYVHEVP